jgi:hypothetical protein
MLAAEHRADHYAVADDRPCRTAQTMIRTYLAIIRLSVKRASRRITTCFEIHCPLHARLCLRKFSRAAGSIPASTTASICPPSRKTGSHRTATSHPQAVPICDARFPNVGRWLEGKRRTRAATPQSSATPLTADNMESHGHGDRGLCVLHYCSSLVWRDQAECGCGVEAAALAMGYCAMRTW